MILRLAAEEIAQFAHDCPPVLDQLHNVLVDLAAVAAVGYQPTIDELLANLPASGGRRAGPV